MQSCNAVPSIGYFADRRIVPTGPIRWEIFSDEHDVANPRAESCSPVSTGTGVPKRYPQGIVLPKTYLGLDLWMCPTVLFWVPPYNREIPSLRVHAQPKHPRSAIALVALQASLCTFCSIQGYGIEKSRMCNQSNCMHAGWANWIDAFVRMFCWRSESEMCKLCVQYVFVFVNWSFKSCSFAFPFAHQQFPVRKLDLWFA